MESGREQDAVETGEMQKVDTDADTHTGELVRGVPGGHEWMLSVGILIFPPLI